MNTHTDITWKTLNRDFASVENPNTTLMRTVFYRPGSKTAIIVIQVDGGAVIKLMEGEIQK